jgi:beta-exotoxin I transport system permease protein
MNYNLFAREIRRNAISLIIWSIILTLLISVTMSVYPTFLGNQSKIMGMFSLIPKEALEFKGISNFSDLLSVLGFYAVNNIIYMMVLGSVYSIVLSSNILLKEEYNKTAEYLLTRPLTRSEIFLSKLAVISINIIILNLITSLVGFIFIELVKKGSFSFSAFLILSLYTLLLNFLFGATGLFLSTVVKRPKPITTFSIGLVIILYFIFTISKITVSISKIGYLSPFKFVDTNVIDPAYKLDPVNLLYFVGISLLFLILSYRIYLQKDIYT